MSQPDRDAKYKQLLKTLKELGNAAIAFSGGVDSTFLLFTAKKALGDKVLAFTIKTPYIPDWELEEARIFCKERGIKHRIIHAQIIEEILNNPKNRCYLCKKHVFTRLKAEALREGYTHLLDGTNADDTGDYRPGMVALQEVGVESPLLQNGITKTDVRRLSRLLGLSTADKPSYACLLTRLPYDYEVRIEELRRIEKAELYLGTLGYKASRVRNHGKIARIEIEKEKLQEFLATKAVAKIIPYFKSLGYEFITLDLEGYRMGSFNANQNNIKI